MSKKHDAIFDVLSGFDGERQTTDKAGARFLKRTTGLGDRLSGELEEKTLHWVDPAECAMWERHNRDYALLTVDNCRDLIDGIKSQGRQEFPAIVRRTSGEKPYEVICGARRHYAVSWLRANNYPQFKYLVEVRDMSDEEAFRLADIENRDREDISDYERAIDYADAIERYYGGKQKAMAERLEVSQPWLSRYLQLAKLPDRLVAAFASIRDIRERHARDLKPVLADATLAERVLAAADELAVRHEKARQGAGSFLDGAAVMAFLKRATAPAKAQVEAPVATPNGSPISVRTKGRKVQIEFDRDLDRETIEQAFMQFMEETYS